MKLEANQGIFWEIMGFHAYTSVKIAKLFPRALKIYLYVDRVGPLDTICSRDSHNIGKFVFLGVFKIFNQF